MGIYKLKTNFDENDGKEQFSVLCPLDRKFHSF